MVQYVWGPLVNSAWGPLVNSLNSACGPTCEQYMWTHVNSTVWAPRGARTHGVAPILGPLVYVLNFKGTVVRSCNIVVVK